jgi:spoIIIJ-associated protein
MYHMKEIEVSARTVEEATKQALEKLGLRLDQVEIEVLTEGRSGVLGIGGENARIRVIENANRIAPDEAITIAQDILENLIAYIGVDASVDCVRDVSVADDDVSNAPVVFNIRGSDLGIIIGRRGQTATGRGHASA